MKMIMLNDILNNKDVSTCDTVHIAGRDITLAQKPHVEATVVRARTVLTRLLAIAPGSEVTSVRAVVTEIEVE